MNRDLRDAAGNATYVLIGFGFWFGILFAIGPSVREAVDVSTSLGMAALVSVVALVNVVLWQLAARTGPLNASSAELTWTTPGPAIRKRFLALLGVSGLVVVIASTFLMMLSGAQGVSNLALIATAAIMVVLPLFAVLQRLQADAISSALANALSAATLVGMGVFAASRQSVWSLVAALIAFTIWFGIGLVRWLRAPRPAASTIPRWSLLRGWDFFNALTSSVAMVDESALRTYSDLRGRSWRKRIELPGSGLLGLSLRVGIRVLARLVIPALVVACASVFSLVVVGPLFAIAIVFLGATYLAMQAGIVWADLHDSPAVFRFLTPGVSPGLASLVVFAVVWACVALVSVPIAAFISVSRWWIGIILLMIVTVVVDRAEEPTSSSAPVTVITPDGLMLSSAMVPRGLGAVIAALVVLAGSLGFSPIVGFAITVVTAVWGVGSVLKNQNRNH